MITHDTARKVAALYSELESAKALLDEVEKEMAKDTVKIDFFTGKLERGRFCELGYPMSNNSRRMFLVEPSLSREIIIAHIAELEAKLTTASAIVAREMSTP